MILGVEPWHEARVYWKQAVSVNRNGQAGAKVQSKSVGRIGYCQRDAGGTFRSHGMATRSSPK